MGDIDRYIIDFRNTKDFEKIYYFYEKYILFICRRYSIDEYSTLLMVHLWQLVLKIDLNKFTSSISLNGYIKKSLKNYAINIYKKYSVMNNIIFNDAILNSEIEKEYNSIYKDCESNIIFTDMIKELSERKYKIINLRYNYGFSDEEIACMIGISRQAVYKNRLSALNILKNKVNI